MYVQRQTHSHTHTHAYTHTHSRTHTRGNILRIRLAAQQIWRRVHFMHTKKLQNRSQRAEPETELELGAGAGSSSRSRCLLG